MLPRATALCLLRRRTHCDVGQEPTRLCGFVAWHCYTSLVLSERHKVTVHTGDAESGGGELAMELAKRESVQKERVILALPCEHICSRCHLGGIVNERPCHASICDRAREAQHL